MISIRHAITRRPSTHRESPLRESRLPQDDCLQSPTDFSLYKFLYRQHMSMKATKGEEDSKTARSDWWSYRVGRSTDRHWPVADAISPNEWQICRWIANAQNLSRQSTAHWWQWQLISAGDKLAAARSCLFQLFSVLGLAIDETVMSLVQGRVNRVGTQ